MAPVALGLTSPKRVSRKSTGSVDLRTTRETESRRWGDDEVGEKREVAAIAVYAGQTVTLEVYASANRYLTTLTTWPTMYAQVDDVSVQ